MLHGGRCPSRLSSRSSNGYRCAVFTDRALLVSRQGKDLTGRYPEVVAAAADLGDVVLDGELVARRGTRLDFPGLRLGRPRREAEGIVLVFVAFDLLAVDDSDVRDEPYSQRRAALRRLLPKARPFLQTIESTSDERAARMAWFSAATSAQGVEGVVIKPRKGAYGDPRAPRVKVRWRITTAALVLGVTGDVDRPYALVLGYRDRRGQLNPVALSLPLSRRVRSAYTPAAGERREYDPASPIHALCLSSRVALHPGSSRRRSRD